MTEINNWLRSTIDWDQQSTEINNWLRSAIHWYWKLTEINNLLRSTIDWDWQSTEIDNQLRLTINWDQQLTEINNQFDTFSTLARFIATFKTFHLVFWSRLTYSTLRYPNNMTNNDIIMEATAQSLGSVFICILFACFKENQ